MKNISAVKASAAYPQAEPSEIFAAQGKPGAAKPAIEKVKDPELMAKVTQCAAQFIGLHDEKVMAFLVEQASQVVASTSLAGTDYGLEIAYTALLEMRPTNLNEAMLAVQMFAVHTCALSLINKSVFQSKEIADATMARATKLMLLYNEQYRSWRHGRSLSGS